jgi:hypothetical protein
MSVELIVAIAISTTALVGLAIISIFICSQQVSRSRQAHRSQRASSLPDKASENAQHYIPATQDHSSAPHDFQQPSQYWPFSNAGSPPRTHQNNTGWLEHQVIPSRGQQSCRRFESSQHDEPSIGSPAESHYLNRRAEVRNMPTRVLPPWQQRTEELHFGHQQIPARGESHLPSSDPSHADAQPEARLPYPAATPPTRTGGG